MTIDLNCDVGEGMPNDALLMSFMSSANIACGAHAGNEDTMKRTVELCIQNNVAIGAHPGFYDKENFGRIDLITAEYELHQLTDLIIQQLILLDKICKEMGATMHHIKLHGALYNRAAIDKTVASIICEAVKAFSRDIFLYGLSGSILQEKAFSKSIPFVKEVFADRTYQDDGTLTPRINQHALISSAAAALQQVVQMIKEQTVTTVNGKIIPMQAETICLHGDGEHAVTFAQHIYQNLQLHNIAIATKK